MSLGLAKTFRAWRLAGDIAQPTKALPVEIGSPQTLDEAKAAVLSVFHKDTLFIEERDAGRGEAFIHAFRVRQGTPVYRRNPQTGLQERHKPLKPDHLFTLPVDVFEPTRPFDAFRDSASGVDRTLVQA